MAMAPGRLSRADSDKRVWFATTADPRYGRVLRRHLEDVHGAEVTGVSHALADRRRLRADLEEQAARGGRTCWPSN
ncbi:hypothetical protein [Streptomyces sp. NPDC002851]